MPLVKLTTLRDLRDARDVVNDMWVYLRTRIPDMAARDLTLTDVQALRQQGYQAYGYRRAAAGNRLDGVAVWRVENLTHPPDLVPQKWAVIPYLCVRASAVNTAAEREKATFLALKRLIPDAIAAGVIGIMCEYDVRWDDLHDFIATWPTAEFERRYELDVWGAATAKGHERAWIRFQPGTPDWNARAGAVTE